jgi:hypothetical protein
MMEEQRPAADIHPASSPQCKALDSKTLYWIAALGTCITLPAVSASLDHRRRTSIETLSQPTAVGDHNWFHFKKEPRSAILWEGRMLRELSEQPENIPDLRMLRVGRSDDGSLHLYVPLERANGTEETGGPSWFVKTGKDQFLRVTR